MSVRSILYYKELLFGSYATGNPTEDSDVDLLVILAHEEPGAIKAAEIRLQLHAEFSMDLIVRTPQKIQERVGDYASAHRELRPVRIQTMMLPVSTHNSVQKNILRHGCKRQKFHSLRLMICYCCLICFFLSNLSWADKAQFRLGTYLTMSTAWKIYTGQLSKVPS